MISEKVCIPTGYLQADIGVIGIKVMFSSAKIGRFMQTTKFCGKKGCFMVQRFYFDRKGTELRPEVHEPMANDS